MDRRSFLASSLSAAGASSLTAAGVSSMSKPARAAGAEPFKLKYAPPLNMFSAHAKDVADRIAWMADQGFRAVEDNGMKRRSKEEQEKIRKALDKHNMEMGVFVAHMEWQKPNFASQDEAATKKILDDIRASVDVAKRVGAKWMTIVPGRLNQRLQDEYQMAYAVDNLKRAAEIFEPHGMVMVLEPLNPWANHPGMYLQRIPQAFMICKAVNSPSCKILFDMYHQQITEGNIIPNIDRAWSEVGYFQIGDNPGRKEPGTGEMNYRNIFAHIAKKGFDGILGMEHGKSKGGKDGEMAVVQAYRDADSFE